MSPSHLPYDAGKKKKLTDSNNKIWVDIKNEADPQRDCVQKAGARRTLKKKANGTQSAHGAHSKCTNDLKYGEQEMPSLCRWAGGRCVAPIARRGALVVAQQISAALRRVVFLSVPILFE